MNPVDKIPTTPSQAVELTRGTVLARGSMFNLAGRLSPMFVAVLFLPFLVHRIGTSRFGLLTLAWMLVGYFSIFDFGLGRALTKVIAEKLGTNEKEGIPPLIWTALCIMVMAGVCGLIVVVAISPLLTRSVLKIPTELRSESLTSFYLLGISIPVVVLTTGLVGVLQAYQRFDLVNALRLPLGIFGFAGPAAIAIFTPDLRVIVFFLLLLRVVICVGHVWACVKACPEMKERVSVQWELLGPLLRFGGWLTLSSVISPVMVQADRFLIGSVLSVSAVAFYATPMDVVTKLLVVPVSFAGVVFPAFATTMASNQERTALVFRRCLNYVFVLIYPACLVGISFAPELLKLWLGPQFAANSSTVLRLLLFGVLMNSFGQIAIALVQSAGRADLSAKGHMVELPLFVVGLWFGVRWHGIDGAAVVWSVRVALDALFLCYVGYRLMPMTSKHVWKTVGVLGTSVLLLVLLTTIDSLTTRLAIVGVITGTFAWFTWKLIFAEAERTMVRQWCFRGTQYLKFGAA